MDSNCSKNKCLLGQSDKSEVKLERINTDDIPAKDPYILYLNNREIIVASGHQLKKYILDDNFSFTAAKIDVPHALSDWRLANVNNESFVYYKENRNVILMLSCQTGNLLKKISIHENKSISKVCHLNGCLVIRYSCPTVTIRHDVDVYSLEHNKMLTVGIISKYFDDYTRSFECLCLRYLFNDYFITFFQPFELDHRPFCVVVWQLSSANDTNESCVTPIAIMEKERYGEYECPGVIHLTGNCFIFRFEAMFELYRIINNELVLIKVVNKISLPIIKAFIPINEFGVILVHIKETNYIFNFHDMAKGKSRQILKYSYKNKDDFGYFSIKRQVTKLFSEDCSLICCSHISRCYKFKAFKLTLDDEFLGIIFHDIRKYARVLAQAHRSKTSPISTLPLELVILIICKTSDCPDEVTVTARESIAYKFFCKP
uniref:Uncharacterized protein n=1 Tax=Cacopsylla melanoneura TaxID=428564 RepID=A0A8D8LKD8_9HEMI